MSNLWLWLKVRRLWQYLVVSALTGIAGSWAGSVVSPVPGQLFADVAGIPLVYLSPVVVAVSLAQWAPSGSYWFETSAQPLLASAVIGLGLVLAFLPPLLASDATEICLISARNGLGLAAMVLCVRRVTSAAAACAAVLLPSFGVWTFGWSESGTPKSWAFLLARPLSAWVLTLAALLLAGGLAGLARPRPATGPED